MTVRTPILAYSTFAAVVGCVEAGGEACPQAAVGDTAPPADTGSETGLHSGEDTGDDCSTDSAEPMASPWPDGSGEGWSLDHATLCSAWTGLTDAPAWSSWVTQSYPGRRYRATSGGWAEHGGIVHEVWSAQGVDPLSGETSEILSGAAYLPEFLPADALGTLSGARHYRCDADGLWLYSSWLRIDMLFPPTNGSVEYFEDVNHVECDVAELLLLPSDVTVGDSWEGRCQGYSEGAGGFDAFDCTYVFTATERESLATPAGTFDALHVVPSGECVRGDSFHFFADEDGFWFGWGFGLVRMDDGLGEHVAVYPAG